MYINFFSVLIGSNGSVNFSILFYIFVCFGIIVRSKPPLAPKKWGKTSFHEELVILKKKVKKKSILQQKKPVKLLKRNISLRIPNYRHIFLGFLVYVDLYCTMNKEFFSTVTKWLPGLLNSRGSCHTVWKRLNCNLKGKL
jgi:hypothetical protein